jgi:hypothetical protein
MTERSLVYKISVRGQAEGVSAIRSIADAAARASREEAKAAQTVARDTSDARRRSTDASKKSVDEQGKHASMLSRLNTKLEVQRVKEAEKGAKDREKAAIKAGDNIVKALGKEVREHEKSEAAKTRATEKEARERQRFVEKAEAATSAHMMAERRAAQNQMARDAQKAMREQAASERRLYSGLARGAGGAFGGALSYGAGLVSRGAHQVAAGAGLNRATDISDVVAERMLVHRTIRRIAIENRGVGGVLGGAGSFDEKAAIAGVAAAAKATGTSQGSLVDALNVFSEKGKGAQGVQSLGRVAQEALAMGVDPAVVAKLRAQMLVSSEATGKTMSEKDLQVAVGKLSLVGKSGVFRAGAMAEQSEALFSRAAASGVDFNTELTRYAAFANEARKSTGSAATARTSINSIQDAIVKKEGKINALGIETRDEHGERNFIDVVEDVIVKTGGKGKEFNQIIDPSRSGKAIQTMLTAYNNSSGTDAERRAAMESYLTKNTADISNMTDDQVVKEMDTDIGSMLDEESTKMQQGVESIRQTLAEQLEPALVKLAKTMPELTEGFAKVIDFVKKHPVLAAVPVALPLVENLAKTGLSQGAQFLANKIRRALPGATGAAGGGVVDAIGNAGSMPVYVTNWPGGGVGIPGGPGGPDLGGDKLTGWKGKLAQLGTWATVILTAAEVGGYIGDKIHDNMRHGSVTSHGFTFGRDDGGHSGAGGANDWRGNVGGRDATPEDKAELNAGRAANKQKNDTIMSYLDADMYNAFAPDLPGDSVRSNDAWAGRKGQRLDNKMNGTNTPLGVPEWLLADGGGGGGSSGTGGSGGNKSLVAMETKIDSVTAGLEKLDRAVRSLGSSFSVYKGPGL